MKQTIESLTKALVSESLASNLFAFYADIAEKEGAQKTAQALKEAAYNKTRNARKFYDHLREFKNELPDDLGTIIIGKNLIGLGNTSENIDAVVASENHRYQNLYPEYAKIATGENLSDVVKTFGEIAETEKNKSTVYNEIKNNS